MEDFTGIDIDIFDREDEIEIHDDYGSAVSISTKEDAEAVIKYMQAFIERIK
jgi:hypothetical protein